jgi:hypothetical protein
VSGSVVTSSGARVFASEVEPRLSVATAQRSPARKSLRSICSYCWLVGCLGSVKAVASLLFLLLPRSATALAEASRPPASRANAPPAQSSVQSCNTTARSIALVLDASGSMNARLPNGGDAH